MKRKIITLISLALFMGAVALNVYMTSSNTQTSSVTLENIEALASSSSSSSSSSGSSDCTTECASGIIITAIGSVLACDGGCECHWVDGYSSDGSLYGFC